jgi:NodT family efflux transporter outer membrane factor (OMF) lipoprotein
MTAPLARRRLLLAGLALAATGCAVGPRYRRPDATAPVRYKAAEGWVEATPADDLDRGPWWTRFGDPALDALVARVEVSNQNVAAAAAAYDRARALVAEQRASLFPVVSLDGGASRSGTGGGDGRTSGSYRVTLGAAWTPDVWGRVRRGVDSATAGAQASAADLAAATLAAQGEVAANYFALRATDAQIALLEETLDAYQRSLEITRNRYEAGVVARTDVLQAETQLANTRADAVALRRQRTLAENAIAVLVGEPPASFALPAVTQWQPHVPDVPPGIPSTLLQRRPDIAAAERRVAAANEQIGIAQAGFYPDFTLTGSLGLGAARIAELASASSLLWSLGLAAAQAIFDAGATRARVAGAEASHREATARYRQTVLAAFEEVENLLTAVRVLADEEALRREAAAAAEQALATVLNRYRAGLVGYLEVVVAQATALATRRALVQLAGERQSTAVALIQALGGGWQADPAG